MPAAARAMWAAAAAAAAAWVIPAAAAAPPGSSASHPRQAGVAEPAMVRWAAAQRSQKEAAPASPGESPAACGGSASGDSNKARRSGPRHAVRGEADILNMAIPLGSRLRAASHRRGRQQDGARRGAPRARRAGGSARRHLLHRDVREARPLSLPAKRRLRCALSRPSKCDSCRGLSSAASPDSEKLSGLAAARSLFAGSVSLVSLPIGLITSAVVR